MLVDVWLKMKYCVPTIETLQPAVESHVDVISIPIKSIDRCSLQLEWRIMRRMDGSVFFMFHNHIGIICIL
jgi:hypothetical protein